MDETINENGTLNGVYSYLYGEHWPQTYYARIIGTRYTVGYHTASQAAEAQTMFDLSENELKKIRNGRWKKIDLQSYV